MPVRSLGPHVDSRAWKSPGRQGERTSERRGECTVRVQTSGVSAAEEKHPFLIVLGIVGILAIIGALAAVMVGASIRALNSAKLEQYFVDGKLATCEPLYPMAQELAQLAADATGKKSPSEDQVHTSEPVSVASDEYSELLSSADHIGTKKNVRSVDVKEATLQPKEVKISPFGTLQTDEESEVCGDLVLNIAALEDNIDEKFRLPDLGVMTPAGTLRWLETTGEEGTYDESQDVSTKYCGSYAGEFRETTLLLVGGVASPEEEPAVWKFELGGETGI